MFALFNSSKLSYSALLYFVVQLISVDKYNQAGELESTQSFSYEPTAEKP